MTRITIDMIKARQLHREKIREARTPLLQALDRDYLIAHERRDLQALDVIVANKQELRDAPADLSIDAAQTPEALKTAVTPLLQGKLYEEG